ncbi:hypothetical protein K438DRAFT_1952954 [Mycena galopus ATCC 62051]|nr:hypothetical protein K438DRAFT_1952954 [Mycena galopus ATCC 62051]
MTDLTLDLATILYDQRVNGYLHLTGTGYAVLLVYDHLLTLESEVRYIWAPGNIRTVAWYFLVRYFALCANLAMFPLAFGNFSTKWTVKDVSPALASPGCYSGTPAHRQLQIAGLWEAMFATDVVFLGLTLYRGYTQSRLLGTGLPPGSLWHVIVRDGVIYYFIICIANLTNIIIYYSVDDSNINAGLSAFTAALSVTAASRLMLNLREVASTDDLASAVSGSIHFVGGTVPIDATDSAP